MRRLVPVLAALALGLAVLPSAGAHPLGNFTVNQYTRVEVGVNGVGLTYVLDLAEIPTFQEQSRIDTDGDGQLSGAEIAAERERLAGEILPRLALQVDGRPAALAAASSTEPSWTAFPAAPIPAKLLTITVMSSAILDALGWALRSSVSRETKWVCTSWARARSQSTQDSSLSWQ